MTAVSATAPNAPATADRPAPSIKTKGDKPPSFRTLLAARDQMDAPTADKSAKTVAVKDEDGTDGKSTRLKDDAGDPEALLALSGAVALTVGGAAPVATSKAEARTAAPLPSVSALADQTATGTQASSPQPAVPPTPADATEAAASEIGVIATQRSALPAADARPARATKGAANASTRSTAEVLAARAAPKGAADSAPPTIDVTLDADADADQRGDTPGKSLAQAVLPTLSPAAPVDDQPVSAQVLAATGADRQLDLAKGNAWLDSLARDISATADGSGTLRFRLAPQILGNLHVEVARGDDGAVVRMTAATSAAQAILSDAKPQLLNAASAHGLHISQATVDLGGGSRQDQSGAGSGTSPSSQQGSGGQSQFSPQGEPDLYHRARKVDPAPSEPATDSPRDDAGYA